MIAMCWRLPSTTMSAAITSADANPSPSATQARSSNQLGATQNPKQRFPKVRLTLDRRLGDGVDRGEPACALVVEPVPRGQLGRPGVAELRLVAVGPDEDLEW